jgi:CSLREA domain-containing protein
MDNNHLQHKDRYWREDARIMRVHFTTLFNRFTLVVALLAALVGSAVNVTPVHAASIVVNSAADTIANDGACTLREALIAAQQNAATGGCAAGSGADTITFAGNYTITITSQLPTVVSSVSLQGRGAVNTIIQAAASPNVATWRVFQVAPTGNLTLNGVTVRHGRCNGSCTVVGNVFPNAGGGIYNSGTLTVKNSTIAGNTGDAGGGIYNRAGTLTVTNSTFSGNTASGEFSAGGGIVIYGTAIVTNSTFSGNSSSGQNGSAGGIYGGGTLTIKNSTIAGNTADYGGGIANNNTSTLAVTNSTIAGNSSKWGSGISNNGTLTVTNSTVSGNSTENDGSGIYNFDGTTTLKNSIVANNSGAGDCTVALGLIINGGNNLDSSTTCGWGSNNGSMSNTNPMLGPLANNGGPTQTMALLTGSPAIDAGADVNCQATDQRGGIRPQGSPCDIGAYEFGATIPTFSDVVNTYWAWNFIERLYAAGITGGCGSNPLIYCPEATVTRAQMAVFLERGIHGTSYNPPAVGGSTGFGDVPVNYWAGAWIKQLAAEGITGGCGGGNYCPEAAVTRAQMAVFLLRSKHGASYAPPGVGSSTGFGDVSTTYWAGAWIKQLVAEGITAGCGSGNYCPESPVTRAQMAVFLVRTFNLP